MLQKSVVILSLAVLIAFPQSSSAQKAFLGFKPGRAGERINRAQKIKKHGVIQYGIAKRSLRQAMGGFINVVGHKLQGNKRQAQHAKTKAKTELQDAKKFAVSGIKDVGRGTLKKIGGWLEKFPEAVATNEKVQKVVKTTAKATVLGAAGTAALVAPEVAIPTIAAGSALYVYKTNPAVKKFVDNIYYAGKGLTQYIAQAPKLYSNLVKKGRSKPLTTAELKTKFLQKVKTQLQDKDVRAGMINAGIFQVKDKKLVATPEGKKLLGKMFAKYRAEYEKANP